MDVVNYTVEIDNLLDEALNDLKPDDFKWFLDYVRNVVNDYDD